MAHVDQALYRLKRSHEKVFHRKVYDIPCIGTDDALSVSADIDKDGGAGSIMERKNVSVIVMSRRIVDPNINW